MMWKWGSHVICLCWFTLAAAKEVGCEGMTVEEERLIRRSIEDQDPVRWCSLCAPQQPQETEKYYFPHFTAVEMKAQI